MKMTKDFSGSERIKKALPTLVLLLLVPLVLCGVDYHLPKPGTLGGKHHRVLVVNAADQFIGTAETGTGQRHAFLCTPKKGMQDIGPLAAPGGG